MGVGSRILGGCADTQGEVGSRPLGPPARGFSVGCRALAIRSGRAYQVAPAGRPLQSAIGPH